MELREETMDELTRDELMHLLTALVGEDQLNKFWQEARAGQISAGLRCTDCDIIARKLEDQ